MKTHTIRNKASTTPIVTIDPKLWARVKTECYPETISLVWSWFLAEYKRVTGKTAHLTHEQQSEFLALVGADARGCWTSRFSTKPFSVYRAIRFFEDGFIRSSDLSVEEAFDVAQAFYATIEKAHP